MAELKVEIVRISNVDKHPNADKLDIISIYGMDYKVITGKGNLKENDLAFYFPIGSIIPDNFVDEFGIKSYYKKRIQAAKLRGIFSEGLLVSVSSVLTNHPELVGYNLLKCEVGEDCTDIFGVTKYSPEININLNKSISNSRSPDILDDIRDFKFSSPEHFKKFNSILKEGEQIYITEKIHGTNFTVYKDYVSTVHVGSRNYFWKPDSDNYYSRILKENSELLNIPTKVQLFGEIYGVQDIKYDCKNGEIKYCIFAVKVDGEYLNFEDFYNFCLLYNLKTVPILYIGEYYKSVVTSFNNKQSTLNEDCIMEGVVINPTIERIDNSIGRVCLKYISEQYLLRQNGTEYQ